MDAKTIENLEIGTWRTTAGDLDVLVGIPSVSRLELTRFKQLLDGPGILELGGVEVAVASLDDLIRSKEIADRPKDREALVELRRLRTREHQREPKAPSRRGYDL